MADPQVLGADLQPMVDPVLNRSYFQSVTTRRIHQGAFSKRVMAAYRRACAICRLKEAQLIDAAHILPDRHPRGEPIVQNGLALCKLHHAAFDANLFGIRPDRRIEVSARILGETDGPMLRHGLQEIHDANLVEPVSTDLRPRADLLEERFVLFQEAS
jgi:putative restriction endonuclease